MIISKYPTPTNWNFSWRHFLYFRFNRLIEYGTSHYSLTSMTLRRLRCTGGYRLLSCPSPNRKECLVKIVHGVSPIWWELSKQLASWISHNQLSTRIDTISSKRYIKIRGLLWQRLKLWERMSSVFLFPCFDFYKNSVNFFHGKF